MKRKVFLDLIPAVFEPFGSFRLKWDSAICVIMLYILINIPLQLCFEVDLPPYHPWSLVDLAVNFFFILDILVSFNTAFFEQSKLIKSRVEISKQYLKLWFWLDVLTSIPFDQLLPQSPNTKNIGTLTKLPKIFRIFRLVKLLRLLKLMNTASKWENSDDGSAKLIGLSKFGIVMFLIGHTAACFFVGVEIIYRSPDCSEENYRGYDSNSWMVRFADTWDQPQPIQYLRALYFAFTTLTTVGYGDITPLLPLEICLTIVMQLLGTSIFGFIIGNISSMVSENDKFVLMIQDKMDTVKHIINSRQLPETLTSRIKRHYEYSWKQSHAGKEDEVFSELPLALKTDFALFIHRDLIKAVAMFRMLSPEVIPSLVARLKAQLACDGDVIIQEGLFGSEMTFIGKGCVQLRVGYISNGNAFEIEVDKIHDGDYFADYAVVLDQARHPVTAIATAYCDLFVLSHQDFLHFSDEFPKSLLEIIDLCKERLISLTNLVNRKRQVQRIQVNFVFLLLSRTVSQSMGKNASATDESDEEANEENKSNRLSTVTDHVVYNFQPYILTKIFQWKNRAQLAVAIVRLDVVKKRHIQKFHLQSSHSVKMHGLGSAGSAQLCSQCAKKSQGFQATHTADDLQRVEHSLQSLKVEIETIKYLIMNLVATDTSAANIKSYNETKKTPVSSQSDIPPASAQFISKTAVNNISQAQKIEPDTPARPLMKIEDHSYRRIQSWEERTKIKTTKDSDCRLFRMF